MDVVALEHLERFAGLPVVEFEFDDAPEPGERVAWRVRTDNGPSEDTEEFAQVFGRFLDTVDTTAVTHLIVGSWGPDYDVSSAVPRQLLLEAAPRLPNLKALFFGEIIREEAEISWIEQCDITPLLHAFPALERLDVRGGAKLELSALSSPALKVLRIETAGLDPAVIRAIGRSDLPNLQTLELLLGIQERGGRATTAHLGYEREFWDLVDAARKHGKSTDRLVREELARAYTGVQLMRFSGLRTLAEMAEGRPPGPEASVAKLFWSEYHKRLGEIAMTIVGTDGLLRPDGPGYPTTPWQNVFLSSRAGTIYSGTSEIQRNIIGERGLGLPKEPRVTG